MQVTAKARYIRMSPKKVRLVLDVIRGMDAREAEKQLEFINKGATEPLIKLLKSAIANAKNNFGLEESNLRIKEITADDGPTLKRWKPRAMGRATPIRKRTSHIKIVLEEKVPSKEIKKKEQKIEEPVSVEELSKIEKKEKPLDSAPSVDFGTGRGRQEIKDEQKDIKITETGELREKRKDKGLEDLRRKREKGFFRRVFSRKTG